VFSLVGKRKRRQKMERQASSNSLGSSNNGHSFVPSVSGKKKKKCSVCHELVMDEGFFSGIECAGCGLTLHEACRGLIRGVVCDRPRANSFRTAGEESSAPAKAGGAPGVLKVSSPKMVSKVAHISFKPDTGKYTGLEILGDEMGALFFGAPLKAQPRKALAGYHDRVPSILVLLARELRLRNGFEAEGIFRVSAERDSLNVARDALNIGHGMEAVDPNSGPHTISCLIKDWFRSLPEGGSCLGPLSPTVLATFAKSENAKVDAVWEKLLFTDEALPEPNRTTFLWMLDLMVEVCERESKNRMNERALSIVIAPSIWEAPKSFPPLQAMNAVKDVAMVVAGSMMYVRRSGKRRNPFGDD
jgi:hypothetical protein